MPLEVFRPRLTPGMEELGECARLWIEAGDIRPFVQIAIDTRQGEIFGIVSPEMLFGNHVLHLESRQRGLFLSQPAILAAMSRPLADKSACGRIHRGYPLANSLRALACSVAMNLFART